MFDDTTARAALPVHRCPLGTYREPTRAAIALAADGFTVKTLADHVRNRLRHEHDHRRPWAWYTNAAVTIACWKERGPLDVRRRRSHMDDLSACSAQVGGFSFEDAMIEFYALAENG